MAKAKKSGTKGEDILLVIEQVKHNNIKGALYVTSQNLAFQANGKDIFDPTYHFSDIKTQKISAEGKSKVQLQIVLHSDVSHNFQFTNPKGQPDQLQERNSVKDLLQQLLPKFKKKISKELEDKSRILQTDRRMFQLYSDLVTTGIMTADEFWTKNADKLTNDVAKSQEIGISGAFLKDVTSQVDGCNSVRYNLTPEVIQSVFKTYPAVKRKHAELVPDTLNENEFWTKFFQSHYFHMGRPADKSVGKDNIFGEYPEMEAKDSIASIKRGMDPSLNLDELKDLGTGEDEGFGVEGYGAGGEDPSAQKAAGKKPASMTNAQLMQRFNLHSSRILTTTEGRHMHEIVPGSEVGSQETPPSGPIVVEDSVADKNLARLLPRAEEELALLTRNPIPKRLSLNLRKPDRYHLAPAKRGPPSSERGSSSTGGYDALQAEVLELPNKRRIVISSKAAQQALLQIGGSKNRRTLGTELQLPPALREEVRNAFASLTEILRHYWSCYPTTDRFLEEKLVRMKKALDKFKTEILSKLAEKAAEEGQSPKVFAPLYEMIRVAEIKFAQQMKHGV